MTDQDRLYEAIALIEVKEGSRTCWYNSDGQLHRIYGPAVIDIRAKLEAWYHNGRLHREGGPALINSAGQSWRIHGKLHRLDGPAVIFNRPPLNRRPQELYYIEDEELTPEQWHERTRYI